MRDGVAWAIQVLLLSFIKESFGYRQQSVVPLDQIDYDLGTIRETGQVINWPSSGVLRAVGEVGGVAFGPSGEHFIFHRSNRGWKQDDFEGDVYRQDLQDYPIESSTILVFAKNITKGRPVRTFGANMFYVPHGIHVCHKGHIWVTDIALHQVFKIDGATGEILMSLGEAFKPGHDNKHFCKPTSVQVAANGEIFVADGYCNSRIMKFNQKGEFIGKFGRQEDRNGKLTPDELSIPHDLVLFEKKNELCVADREHSRIVCYNAGLNGEDANLGKLIRIIDLYDYGTVYGLDIFPKTEMLVALCNNDKESTMGSSLIYYDLQQGKVVGTFQYPGANGFGHGHAIAVDKALGHTMVGSLTHQCAARYGCEMQRVPSAFRPRNIWLFYHIPR